MFVRNAHVWRRRVFILRPNLEEVGEFFAAGDVGWQTDQQVAVIHQGRLLVLS